AAGSGTDFVFKNHKFLYLTPAALLESPAPPPPPTSFPDDPGPTTVSYWKWCQSQVVIIDNVGPLIAANPAQGQTNLDRFIALLTNDLRPVADVLRQCHTVWVIGDLRPPTAAALLPVVLDDFARAISRYCNSSDPAFVIELGHPRAQVTSKGTMLGTPRREPDATNVQDVRRVS